MLEHIVNTAAPADGRDSLRKLIPECHEVERPIDRFRLGLNPQRATGRIELSLIHDHVLPHPARSSAPTLLCACEGTLTCDCLGHSILRLYKH
jgi:hypothetical protein